MMTPLRKRWAFLLILLVVTAAGVIFWSFRGLYFDARDLAWLSLARTQSLGSVFTQPSIYHPGEWLYQPLADWLVWCQGYVCNGDPLPTALVIIAVHLLSVLLLFLVARPAFGSGAAGMAALIFAWHPLVSGLFGPLVEGVQWTFALFFLLSGLWGYSLIRTGRHRLGLVLGSCGMLCISAMGWGYTLLPMVLLYDLSIERKENEPGWAKRILFQIPLFVAIAIPLAVSAWRIDHPEVRGPAPASGAANFEWSLLEIDSARIANTHFLLDPMKETEKGIDLKNGINQETLTGRENGFQAAGIPYAGWIFIVISGIGFIMGAARYRTRFFLKLLVGLLLYTAITHTGMNGTDPASPAGLYPANAFLCLCTGLMVSCLVLREWNSGIKTFAFSLLPMLALPALSAWTIYPLSRNVLHAGLWIRDCRAQVLGLLGPDHSAKEPVFLLNTPAEVLPVVENKGDPLPLRSLGFAFAPPFLEKEIKLYPLNDAPYLSLKLHVPFMLYMYGEGEVFKFDEKTHRLRLPNVDEVGRQILGPYWKQFCQGRIPARLTVQTPKKNMSLPIDREKGFDVIFPLRKAKAERVAMLTRYGPTEVLFDDLKPEMVFYQGRKPYFTLHVMDELIRRTLAFFPGEKAFMWVESINDEGEVFHRSELLWFYLM